MSAAQVGQFTRKRDSRTMPRHLAVIMDGNRRWARQHKRPTSEGHAAGAVAARRLVDTLLETNIPCVTIFAFASANWQRSNLEVRALFILAREQIKEMYETCRRVGISLEFPGRRSRLPPDLQTELQRIEDATAGARRLRIAIDYSGREAILQAARCARYTETQAEFEQRFCGTTPPVDLLIRTGGHQRLSDFLLWECAFAELYFSNTLWPDFTPAELHRALSWYTSQSRNFGN